MYPTGAERIVDPTKFLDTACKYRSWEQKLAQQNVYQNMNKQNRLHFLYNTKRKVKRLHKISNAASSGSFHVDETGVTIRR